jgi:hypothetical protein
MTDVSVAIEGKFLIIARKDSRLYIIPISRIVFIETLSVNENKACQWTIYLSTDLADETTFEFVIDTYSSVTLWEKLMRVGV